MTFKEITTEDLINNVKGVVGRPDSRESDSLALDDILRKPETLKALISELKRFSIETEMQKRRSKNLNDDIKAVAQDTFKLSVKKFKELMSAVDGDIDGVIQTMTSTVDTLEIIKEKSVGV